MNELTLDPTETRNMVRRILDAHVPALRLLLHAGEAIADRAFAGRDSSPRGKCGMCRITRCATRDSCYRPREFATPPVTVLAGANDIGGCGWMAAEVLADAGCETTLIVPEEAGTLERELIRTEALRITARCAAEPALPLRILLRPTPSEVRAALGSSEVIVDAIEGMDFTGRELPEPARTWVALANEARSRGTYLVAADVPSGLDARTGAVATPCVEADVTVALIVYKPGLLCPERPVTGQLCCDWIGLFPLDYQGPR